MSNNSSGGAAPAVGANARGGVFRFGAVPTGPVHYTLSGFATPVGGRSKTPLLLIGLLAALGYVALAPSLHLPGAEEEDRLLAELFPPGRSSVGAPPPTTSPTGSRGYQNPIYVPPQRNVPTYPQPPVTSLPPTYPVAFIVADKADAAVALAAKVPEGALYYLGYDPLAPQAGHGAGYGVPSYLPVYDAGTSQPQQTVVVGVAGRVKRGTLATFLGANREQTAAELRAFIAANPWSVEPATGEVPVS